jgi:hypothetical protein
MQPFSCKYIMGFQGPFRSLSSWLAWPFSYSPLIPRLSCFPLHVIGTYMIFMHQRETQNSQMRENMWHLFKFDLILWMITSSYIYFPALGITSFLAIPERIHCVTDSHLPFVSSVNRQLGWFHSLAATVIDATVNVYTEAWSQRIRYYRMHITVYCSLLMGCKALLAQCLGGTLPCAPLTLGTSRAAAMTHIYLHRNCEGLHRIPCPQWMSSWLPRTEPRFPDPTWRHYTWGNRKKLSLEELRALPILAMCPMSCGKCHLSFPSVSAVDKCSVQTRRHL